MVRLFAIPWTVAHQALLPMELPRQEYWSGLPFLLHRRMKNLLPNHTFIAGCVRARIQASWPQSLRSLHHALLYVQRAPWAWPVLSPLRHADHWGTKKQGNQPYQPGNIPPTALSWQHPWAILLFFLFSLRLWLYTERVKNSLDCISLSLGSHCHAFT